MKESTTTDVRGLLCCVKREENKTTAVSFDQKGGVQRRGSEREKKGAKGDKGENG